MLHRRVGATLVDIVVAVAIACAMLAVALPSAGQFLDGIRVRGAVTEIESLFSLARHAAISRGTQAVLEIDAASGTISVRSGADQIRTREVGPAHGVTLSTTRTSMT